MHIATTAIVSLHAAAVADTEIYRCPLADGTIAFQEMPCAEPEVEDAADDDSASEKPLPAVDDFFVFENPYDAPQENTLDVEPALPKPVSQDRDECIRQTRAAIDTIDAELADAAASAQDSRAQLAELLELTQQLRACKAL